MITNCCKILTIIYVFFPYADRLDECIVDEIIRNTAYIIISVQTFHPKVYSIIMSIIAKTYPFYNNSIV